MKLNAKLRLLLLLIGVVPLAGSGLLCYQIAAGAWTQAILDHLEGFASIQDQHVETLLKNHKERLALVASRTQLRLSLASFLDDPAEEHRARMTRIITDAAASVERFERMSILNPEGTVIASTEPELVGMAMAEEPFFEPAREGLRVDSIQLDDEDRLYFILAGPLILDDRFLGLVMVHAAADDLLALLREHRGLGMSGETMLVKRDENQNGVVVAPLRHDPLAAFRRAVPKEEHDALAMLALRGVEQVFPEIADYRGVPVMAATRHIEHTDWGMVVKIDYREAMQPLIMLRRLSMVAVVLTLVAVIVISVRVSRSITRPIRHLTESAARISAGDLDGRVEIESHDEIGLLGRSFNDMAESLGDMNRDLEGKIKARTADLEREVADHEKTENNLERERNRLRVLIDNSPDLIYVKDTQKRFVIANAAVAHLMGADDPDQLLGKTDADFHSTELAAIYAGDEDLVLGQGESLVGHEEPSQTADGERRWVSTTKVPLRNPEGKIVGLVGIGRDITEHREAEEALHKAEAKYRLLVEQLPAITYIAEFTPERTWTYVSPQIETFLGYAPDEWTADRACWLDALHPHDREHVLSEEKHTRDAREPFRSEYRLATRAGQEVWVRDTATFAPATAGGADILHGVLYDITTRKQAEGALRASEDHLHSIIDTARDAFISINSSGLVVDWNRQAEAVFGWTHKEIIGKSLADTVVPHEDREAHRQGLQQFLESGEGPLLNKRTETEALHRDGHVFPIEMTIWPLRMGSSYRFNAFVHDITDRKRAEEELRQAADALTHSNKELEIFAYVASHDLQEPLRAIAGCVQILEKRYREQLDDRAETLIRHIVEGAQRMQSLISDLLEYSRVERRGHPFSEVDCDTALEDALTNLRTAIEESDARVTHDRLPTVQGDPTQLMQLFQNLVSNGIKYRQPDTRPEVHVGVGRKDDCWHFTVQDSGLGIAPEHFERVFGIFQPLHTREEYSGTGIGLAVCKRIVERHKGDIWVGSRPGEGTTMHFTIPSTLGADASQ